MNIELHARVEHMLAKPYPTRADLEEHCRAAREAGYRAVLVTTSLAETAFALIEETDLKLACAIGFPFGSADSDTKRFETEAAIDFGAHEIELVPSISRLIENDYKFVLREIRDIVTAADERPVKVVIESHLWSEEQLSAIVQTVLDSGAQFLSTSIALQGRHASPEAIHHLRELAGPSFGIKVAGLKNFEGVEDLIAAGAHRIGLT